MGRETKINFSVGDLIKFRKHGQIGRLLFSECTETLSAPRSPWSQWELSVRTVGLHPLSTHEMWR